MHIMKHVYLFIKHNITQIKRKWIALPLLLLFPVILIGSVIAIVISFIFPVEQGAIRIGIVDLDQSQETQTILTLLTETSQLGPLITLDSLSEEEAKVQINNNQLSAYIIFPDKFITNLYTGESVTIPVIGNPNQMTESYVVKEIMDSVMRHINTSQANILMINHYAKQISMGDTERNDFLFEQFMSFLLYAMSKDKIISEEKLLNYATSSTTYYYGTSSLFILITVWLLLLYNFLYKEETIRIKNRMKLYGVTELQQMVARMIVAFIITACLAICSFMGLTYVLPFELYMEDYLRLIGITFLYSIIFLELLAITEMVVTSHKLRLLLQSIITLLVIGLSGAILPTIYFPLYIQDYLPYLFSFKALYWLQEILLKQRLYADYSVLLIYSIAGLFILLLLSIWRERVRL